MRTDLQESALFTVTSTFPDASQGEKGPVFILVAEQPTTWQAPKWRGAHRVVSYKYRQNQTLIMDVDTAPCKPDLASRLESVFGRLGTSPSPAAANNGTKTSWCLQQSTLGFQGGKAVDLDGYSSEEEAAPRPAVPPGSMLGDEDDDEDDYEVEEEGGQLPRGAMRGGARRRRGPSGSSSSGRRHDDDDIEAEDADAGLLPRPCFGEDRRRDEQFLSSCRCMCGGEGDWGRYR